MTESDENEAVSNDTQEKLMVVNDVLCFITTAIDTKTNDFMVNSCIAYYEARIIREAKEVLFSYTDEKLVKRRGENSKKADILDIIDLVRKLEESDKIQIPRFVAGSFNSLPPGSGYDVIASIVVDLIDEIKQLKSEISILKECNNIHANESNNIALILDEINEIKRNINKRKSVNSGSKFEGSASFCMSPLIPTNDNQFKAISDKFLSSGQTPSPSDLLQQISNKENKNLHVFHDNYEPSAPSLSQIDFSSADVNRSIINTDEKIPSPRHLNENNCKGNNLSSIPIQVNENYADKVKYGIKSSYNKTNNLKKNNVIGNKSINSSKFKSAERNLDVFLGNCSINTSCDNIKEHINDEIGINAICTELNSNSTSKSFKVTVLASYRDKLLNAELWPTGIICRKFYKLNKKSLWYNSNK